MLGHVLFRWLADKSDFDVHATTLCEPKAFQGVSSQLRDRLEYGVDLENIDRVLQIFYQVKPDCVVNCTGVISEDQILKNQSLAINVNARIPHQLALICQESDINFIHISSDVVFDGKKGMYAEQDEVNVSDLYGASKLLGEVAYENCVTIRTSIIGHALIRKTGLVEWFLSQKEKVRGYTKAIYSGFPTIELAKIISDYILPNDKLSGVYHVSSDPISKYDLLKLIGERYGKHIEVDPDDGLIQDRSLDSSYFRLATGYKPPSWKDLINDMHNDYINYNQSVH